MNFGFFRAAAAVPKLKVADPEYNVNEINILCKKAYGQKVQAVVFPELCITGYTCGDLFHQDMLQLKAESSLNSLLKSSLKDFPGMLVIIGMPVRADNSLYNCAVGIINGEILGAVPKSYIPGYREFYEERWFKEGKAVKGRQVDLLNRTIPFGTDLLFKVSNFKEAVFGIELCEDLWTPVPPSSLMAMGGAAVIFNLSASNEVIGKYDYRKNLIMQQSGSCIAGYVFSSCGVHESSTDLVFGGQAIIAENGALQNEGKRFEREGGIIVSDIDINRLHNDRIKNTCFMEYDNIPNYRIIEFDIRKIEFNNLKRHIGKTPFVPSVKSKRSERCSEIFNIQTSALAKRLLHTGCEKAVIGISGGLDSTLALLVTVKAFDMLNLDRSNITAVTMPGFGTTDATYANAVKLIEKTGAGLKEINIKKACLKHFENIGHNPDVHDTSYENVQARERTQILMDLANKENGIVIGTGDLSEIALGWSTYNGDHMSMYAVNSGVPKTLVKYLIEWVSEHKTELELKEVLVKILNTPITPELLPPDEKGNIKQKTEDIIGPYVLHDFFLYHMIRYGAVPQKILYLALKAFEKIYDEDEIKKWLRVFLKRFFSQQFKRSCIPDGPKVGTISLSPRGDWRMPSDSSFTAWLE